MPTTTLSSVGVSNAINADWRSGKPITGVVTIGSTTMTTDYTVQITVDDGQLAGVTPVWVNLGSSTGSSGTHFSSASADSPVVFSLLNPVAGLRISSTAISSSSITLKVLQGVGG